MTRNKRQQVVEDIAVGLCVIDFLDRDLGSIRQDLDHWESIATEKAKAANQPEFQIRIDFDPHHSEINVVMRRLENAAEAQSRRKQEKKSKEVTRKNRYKTYLQLKQEFEGKDENKIQLP